MEADTLPSMIMLRINTEVGEEEEEAECISVEKTPTVSSVRHLPPDLTSIATSPIRHAPSASNYNFTPGPTGDVYVYKITVVSISA